MFYGLRKFHNKIKRDLYSRYTGKMLLEIASGKGGDQRKVCDTSKIVIGYDINPESVKEAKRRAKQIKNCNTTFIYFVKDLSKETIIPRNKFAFDIVSSMFSFHYFFKNKDTLNTIMESIKSNIKHNGYFIGTIFDYERVKDTTLNCKEVRITKNKIGTTLFGNEIEVYIGSTVLDKPEIEYLIPFDKFVLYMKKNGFQLVESRLFNPPDNLHIYEKQLSCLYRTFVFKKTS